MNKKEWDMNQQEEPKKSYGEIKQAILFIIIIILLIILLLLGIGFFSNNQLKEAPKTPGTTTTTDVEEVPGNQIIDLNDYTIGTTRLAKILGALNNAFLETVDSHIGYIYQNTHADATTLSSNYVIYTAISYLEENGELENYIEAQYNKKASADLVDEVIKNIFGDISYNRLGYLGNEITCPNGKYDIETDSYFINTTCAKNDVKVDTYNIRIVEKPDVIEVYQAISWVKNIEDEYTVYKDIELNEYISNNLDDHASVTNYTSFHQYKFTFTKGSDNLYHFTSIDLIS